VDDLEAALDGDSTVDVAVAQDWVCEMAERLRFRIIITPDDRFDDIFVDEDFRDIRDLIAEHTDVETTNDILTRNPNEIATALENAGVDLGVDEVARFRERLEERVVVDNRIDDLIEVDDDVMNALNNEGVGTAGSLVNADLEEVSNRTGISLANLNEVVTNIELFRPRR
jgi:hypothetical protein